MQRSLFVFLFFLIHSIYCAAQDTTVKRLQNEALRTLKKNEVDSIPGNWKKGGLVGLNLTQGSLSNWAAGGDDFTLAVNGYLNGFAYFTKGKHSWDNNLDIFLGYIRTTSLGTRKNDDRVDILSKYKCAFSPQFSTAALFNFRTQMFDGFTYVNDSTRLFSSSFMSPAYVIFSPGLDWKPFKNFSIFVSPITSRWVIIGNERLAAKGNYAAPGEQFKNELGAFATLNFTTDQNRIVTYRGRADIFSNYRNNPQNIDIFMQNIFAAKIFKIFALTWNIDVIYDDDARLFGENNNAPRTQLKSMFGLGLRVKI